MALKVTFVESKTKTLTKKLPGVKIKGVKLQRLKAVFKDHHSVTEKKVGRPVSPNVRPPCHVIACTITKDDTVFCVYHCIKH